MKRRRTAIALLLTLALPYAAIASLGDGLRCPHSGMHAGMHAPVADAMSMHHDHAAMQHAASTHAHHASDRSGGHDTCDCPVKCDCAQHCAGAGCGAALPLQALEIAGAGRTELPVRGYAALIREAWHSPAFRPPIAALPSAA